jgi:hypothetical protein
VPAPQLHLPAERYSLPGVDVNRRYLLWSSYGFPEIVNGRASTNPELIEELIKEMKDFPSAATVERLRQFGGPQRHSPRRSRHGDTAGGCRRRLDRWPAAEPR